MRLAIACIVLAVAACGGRENGSGRTVIIPVRESSGIVPAVVRLLDDEGIGVHDVVVRRPTLDDVFLELTGHAADESADGDDEIPQPVEGAA